MTRQWVVELDTGRFGDWVIVQASDENDVKRQLTRTQKRRVLRMKPVFDPVIDPPARLKRAGR